MRIIFWAWCLLAAGSAYGISKPNGIVYGEPGRSEGFDPYTAHEAGAIRLTELLFDSMITLSKSGDYAAHLAKSWNIGPGNTYVDINLTKGVAWHSDKGASSHTLSADDVIKTIGLLTNPQSEIPNQDRFSIVNSAEKLDEHKVRIRFRRAVRDPLRYLMFKILPAHTLANVAALKRNGQFAQNPVGTGPYRFLKASENGEVVLEANPSYFKGPPKIGQMVMKSYADQSIMAKSLMFNALDLVAYVSPRDLDEIIGDRRLTVMPYDALSFTFLAMNCGRGVLRDKRVRMAISRAINRKEMLDAFFQSRGQLISGPFPPTSWAYNIDVPELNYDLNEARKLLASAGFKGSDNDGLIEDRSGTPVKLLFAVPLTGESEIVKRMALAFKSYLEKVGIGVELQFMDWLVWKKRVLGEHDYDLTIASWSFDDASNINSLFHSSSARAYGNNFVNFRNPSVDALLTEAGATSDLDKKRAIYHRLHATLAEEAPYGYLWTLMHHAAHNERLSRVDVNPFSFFKDITMWQVK